MPCRHEVEELAATALAGKLRGRVRHEREELSSRLATRRAEARESGVLPGYRAGMMREAPGIIRGDVRVSAAVSADRVWVRLDCYRYGDRGPYHWTADCVEGRYLIEISRADAETRSHLRPCKLCASRDRRSAEARIVDSAVA